MSSRHIYHHHHYSEIVFIEPGGCLSSSGSLLCTRTTCIFTCNGDNSSRDRFSTTREEQIYVEDGQVLPIMSAEMVIVFAVDCFRQSKRYCVLPSVCSSCSLFFFAYTANRPSKPWLIFCSASLSPSIAPSGLPVSLPPSSFSLDLCVFYSSGPVVLLCLYGLFNVACSHVVTSSTSQSCCWPVLLGAGGGGGLISRLVFVPLCLKLLSISALPLRSNSQKQIHR